MDSELKSKLEELLPQNEGYQWISDTEPYYIRPFDKDAARRWRYGVDVVHSDEIYPLTVTPDDNTFRIWGDPYNREYSVNRSYTIKELDQAIDIAKKHTEACIREPSLLNNYQ